MADTRAFPDSTGDRSQTGIVSKIRLENFMCHNNLEIELGSRVNFITGQNGSGKSAILTALCVAFGCRAKSTDRASTLKDFIKTGCSSALVHVEIKNEGEDAFKPETYGNIIIIERRISESTSSLVLKDHQGKKIATRREDLRELVEHFNIDVENPCVVMSQDKSREFLHSGNDKDKFKFFFKATLLSQVDELLNSIKDHLYKANAMVLSLEEAIAPAEKELKDLQGKIKSMEQVEEIAQEAQKLRKKLAWSWVYDVDKQLHEQSAAIVNLKEVRMAQCQERIDQSLGKMDELSDLFAKKKAQSDGMMARTSEVRRKKDELEQSLSLATKERLELEQEHDRKINLIRNMMKRVKLLEQQVNEVHEQHMRSTQAEESELEEKLKELQDEFNRENSKLESLKEEEDALSESLLIAKEEIRKIANEIEGYERKQREIRSAIHDCRLHQTNKVTAFGGARVTNLLQAIERHHHRFKRPPIGPIGAHVTLVHGDKWAVAVENAIGNLLNAFIVTDHKDSLLLRACAREANYNHLRIIIYDFSRPRLNIPNHMLPQTNHPTTISVIHSDSHTVVNVLVDVGSAERQVLVGDYAMGTNIAFDQRISNLKEVYTLEGHRMFSRGSAQTILPANKNARSGRLCGSYDDQIKNYEQEAANLQGQAQQCHGKKRDAENDLQILQDKHQSVKRRRTDVEKKVMHKDLALQDLKKSYAAEASAGPASSVDELHIEKNKIQDEIQEKENLLTKFQVRLNEAVRKAKELKLLYDNLKESAQKEIDALDQASHELTQIEEDLQFAESKKIHYERVMKEKVLDPLKDAEAHYRELEHHRKENYRKASIICPESEVETLEGHEGRTPEQLSALLDKINRRLQQESQRFEESIDDIRVLYESKERKILRKRRTYKGFREKLTGEHGTSVNLLDPALIEVLSYENRQFTAGAMEKALDLRWSKFQRNATLLKRQLTWQFNGHLKKKGFSGQIKVSYEDKTLAIEVKMPQDASNSNVRDTRGLSGGERSFSTLCFALSLHEMTEAPFRAMDEFDVFMDAVSRKISLDTLVDFALAQESQWIFITPHDISMVKQDARIKKQQMAAPRA